MPHNFHQQIFTRNIVQAAFSRWARKDADSARAQLDSIARAQKMTTAERQLMRDTVAWQYMPYATPEQAKWRDSVIQDTASDTLRERRVRLALSQNQPAELALWLERLSPESKKIKRSGVIGERWCCNRKVKQ